MMRTIAAFLLVAAGCNSNREQHHYERDVALTGSMPQRMNNCPSSVPSAKTTTKETAEGIDLTITSEDPLARARIQTLARLHGNLGESVRAFPPHTGTHAGPGSIGHCPIIHASTTVIYGEVPDGAVVHVIAHNPRDVTKLQVATRARLHALIPTS